MRTIDRQARDTDASLSQAFTDLTALMQKAKDMVWSLNRVTASFHYNNIMDNR